MYNAWDLIGRYIPLLKPLVLSSRKGLMAAILSRFLLIPAFYYTAKYGDQGWMIMLTSFLGLSNGYLTVCVLTAAPKGYKVTCQFPCFSFSFDNRKHSFQETMKSVCAGTRAECFGKLACSISSCRHFCWRYA